MYNHVKYNTLCITESSHEIIHRQYSFSRRRKSMGLNLTTINYVLNTKLLYLVVFT